MPDAIIYVIHVIEWTDEDEERLDLELTERMEHDGRRLLSMLLLDKKIRCERIVKIGDPATRITEVANSLDIDIIFLGSKGLDHTRKDIGHVTKRVISVISKPIVIVN
jgi:nucleotide-binding universal stress UspA family protein